jgi:DNA adenine methylase
VDLLVLNDFDRRIFSAWHSMLFHTDQFIDRIRSTAVSMELWMELRDLVEENSPDSDRFELGFATYFLNRTNRSGVILGAGPIGGYEQRGKWPIDARWYPETMAQRIKWIGERRDNITVSNRDGLSFLKEYPDDRADSTFFFVDPPYVQAGAKLYLNAMSDLKHRDLATFLTSSSKIKHWLVTYDDNPLVVDAYKSALIERLPVRYSLNKKRTEEEVVFVPA